jgi:hypothetical protein
MSSSKPTPCTDPDYLEELLEEATLRTFGGMDARGEQVYAERGVAGIQALKLCLELKGQLDLARAARDAAEGEGLSDDELLDKLREEFADAPDMHLWAAVEAYCSRHALPLPRRVAVAR